MAELAKLSAEELLEELEKELTENKPMQQELSEIAEDTVEEAGKLWKKQPKKKSDIAENLENADKEVVDEKKKLAKELDKLALEIKRLADREVRQASNWPGRQTRVNPSRNLPNPREELLDIAEEAKEGAKPEEAIAELAQNRTGSCRASSRGSGQFGRSRPIGREWFQADPRNGKSPG